ncbi:hypothetical protein BT96DRAFT_1070804 [Gymnopus androsaceus JB14]|uniref:Uncharacterized protein n=1 Tax=Gymnopus androsaceus JB14 TaxID=1447944 RepID=A0A6A4GUY4_9AGAR|nr:hypothetical protein BT96DRAFT_1070804 [Gymnopus androsaceus JB14]
MNSRHCEPVVNVYVTTSTSTISTSPTTSTSRSSPDFVSNPLFHRSEAGVSELPQMIRKPKGEVNRPGRGGYNLDRVVNWTEEQSKEIKKYIKHAVVTKLDCTQSFTKQPRNSLLSIRQEAVLEFPWLANYADLWVVDDLVRCRLLLQQAALKKKNNALLAAEARARASRKAALQAAAAAL